MEPRSTTRSDRVAWAAVLCSVALVPFTTSNLSFLQGVWPSLSRSLTVDQGALPKLVVLLVCCAVGGTAWAYSVTRENAGIRSSRFHWAVPLFLLLAVVSAFTSVSPATSLLGAPGRREGLLAFFAYALLAWLVVQTVQGPRRLRELTALVTAVGAIIAAYGILQALGLDPQHWGARLFEERRTIATLGNPDFFGGYLVLVLPLALSVALLERRALVRNLSWVATVLVAVGLALSGVRTAWVGTIVGMAVFGVALIREGFRVSRRDLSLGALGVLLVSGVAVFAAPGGGLVPRVAAAFSSDGSLASRVMLWRGALASIAQRPVLGWGPDTFRYAWLQYEVPEYVAKFAGQGIPNVAHSQPLQIAVTCGMLGAIAYFLPFGVAMWRSRRIVFARGDSPAQLLSAAWWASAAGYLAFLAAGLTDVASHMLLWVALGVLVDLRSTARVVPVRMRRALAGGTIVLIVAAIAPAAAVLRADRLAAQGLASRDPSRLYERMERAVGAAPWDPEYRLLLADAYAQEVVDVTLGSGERVDPVLWPNIAERTGRALDQYDRVLDGVPREVLASGGAMRVLRWNQRATGTDVDATIIGYGERYARYAPVEPVVRSEMLRSLYNLGEWDELASCCEPYEAVDPGAAAWRARAEWELGAQDDARSLIEGLVETHPKDARVVEVAAIVGVTVKGIE